MSEYTRLIYMQSNNRYNVSTICGIESYKVEPTRTNPSIAIGYFVSDVVNSNEKEALR